MQDLRQVEPEQHWEQFAEAWTALMSYRYLGKRSPDLDEGVERETMPLRPDMRNAVGGIMAAPLCIAAPEPYWLDSQCIPAPVVMSYEVLDSARDVEQVDVLRDVVHLGRTMGFSRSRVVDAADHSRVIAVSCGVGVSLGDVPDDFVKVPNPPVDLSGQRELPALPEAFGASCDDAGTWRLPPLRPELSSPHAALHLGPINVVLEAAATDAAADRAGTADLQVESWTVMMLRPGVAGPFRASAEVVGAGSERVALELTLRDEGRDDRVISVAQAVYRRA